jgi:NADH-quinone oxidoreductase subunit L
VTAFDLVIVSIPGLPLAAALLATVDRVLGGRFLGPSNLARVAVWAIGLSAVSATVTAFTAFGDPTPHQVVVGKWLETGSLRVDIGFLVDPLSAVMAISVAGLGWLVARFSVNYLHNESGFGRYFTILPLFVGAMLWLVLADNYLMLFVAWEVVGACSYLLIAFYQDRASSADAGTRAFVLNRIGDAGLLAGLFLLAGQERSLGYLELFASPLPAATATAIGFCLLFGATGKSAQIPLGGWLARAMEGPTPSSALIHGATMVTAGVYLVVRSAPIYDQAPVALLAVGLIGAATALFGQLAGLAQADIKGMLAASTNAHLGFMLLFCGLGLFPVAVFHLVAHAFYKTNLFLTAPSILHHLHGGPDPTAVARPADTGRPLFAVVGAAALLLLVVPFLAIPVPLPLDWSRGALVLGSFAAVALAGLWFAARRVVGATFHHDRENSRRTALAVAVGAAIAAAGIVAGITPGGISGSWFAELLAPAVSASNAVAEAPPLASAVLVAALICLTISGLAVPRFFDRFRPEQPAGSGSPFSRRVYFAASNRAWLDDFTDRTSAAAIRLGSAFDRFDRTILDPLTGALVPTRVSSNVTWEAKLAAATATTAHAAPAPDGSQPAPALRRVEPEAKSLSGGLYGGLTDTASAAGRKLDSAVFQRGIESGIERIAAVLSALSETIERRVFELGPERVGHFGERIRRQLLRFEGVLGRPAVTATVAFALLAAMWAAG